ncbi:MAG TPA: hypothetical protein VIV14_06540, partial [Gammaproteobacteria bacterium]
HDQRAGDAVAPQTAAVDELSAARERFLDLRALIDLMHEAESRAGAFLSPRADQDVDSLLEYAPSALELHARNHERAERATRLVDEKRDAAASALSEPSQENLEDDQRAAAEAELARLNLAAQLNGEISDSMAVAQSALNALVETGPASAAEGLATAREAIAAAVEDIAELRALFFNLIEHLKETARRQIELGDETEAAAVLADDGAPDETALALGPLAPRQRQLAERAGRLAEALAAQSQRLAEQPQTPTDEAPVDSADMAARLAGAGEHTGAAAVDMNNAAGGLEVNPPPLAQLRSDQSSAVDNLLAAIEMLEPPQQRQSQDQQEQQDQQQNQNGGADGDDSERREEAERDPSQLLQGVRDREAQRRAQQAERERLRYDPVEKDW